GATGGGGGATGGGGGATGGGGGATGGGGGAMGYDGGDDPFLPDGGYSWALVDAGTPFSFTEGPLWLPAEGALLFTDIPNNRIWRLAPPATFTVFREPSGRANGLAMDPQGRLLACEHDNRRVSRTLADGGLETVADRWDGGRLNSPNDAIVRSDGTVYFTDPPYGVPAGQQRELNFQGVFRVDPSGALHLVASDMNRPNGVMLSLDERTLYVADTAANLVRAWDVAPDGATSNPRTLVPTTTVGGGGGGGDGMALDLAGNLYVTTNGGVKVFRPDGGYRGRIVLPEAPANVSFGDADGRTLYVTARAGLYRVRLLVPGLP
ncbi:MAG: SMP-30/gluconolactonase/LRE family protein, partial [Myxococcota bacterium]